MGKQKWNKRGRSEHGQGRKCLIFLPYGQQNAAAKLSHRADVQGGCEETPQYGEPAQTLTNFQE